MLYNNSLTKEVLIKILIVEDDIQVTNYIVKRLTNWGYKIFSASTGEMAIKLVAEKQFDLILLDIMLPDYIAYDLIPEFKKIHPDIKIVTMTGQSTRELEQKIRKQGILYYMVKPIESKNLKLLLDHIKNKHE